MFNVLIVSVKYI